MTSWGREPSATNIRPRAMSWGGGAAAQTAEFRIGDDVIHAAFGDGVVNGIEAGGWSSCASPPTAASAS